jgi:hypothetical protein
MKVHTLPKIQPNESHGCLVVINVRKTLPKTLFNGHVNFFQKTFIFSVGVGILMQLAVSHTTLKTGFRHTVKQQGSSRADIFERL